MLLRTVRMVVPRGGRRYGNCGAGDPDDACLRPALAVEADLDTDLAQERRCPAQPPGLRGWVDWRAPADNSKASVNAIRRLRVIANDSIVRSWNVAA